jgi:hypothetical protein
MRYLLPIVIAVLAAACEPAPVWMPGDPPLAIWAETEQLWVAIDRGCWRWDMTGLRCRRASSASEAGLVVRTGDAEGGHAITRYRLTMSGSWEWEVVFAPETLKSNYLSDEVAAHELGHVLGILDHLERGNLMFASPGQPEPTDADLEALADVWGEAPWLD